MGQEDNFICWRTLEQEERLKIRVDCAQGSLDRQKEWDLRQLAAKCRLEAENCVLFRPGPVKFFCDGVIENDASVDLAPGTIQSICKDFEVACHATGCSGVHFSLAHTNSAHLRIEHVEVLEDEDIEEIVRRKIVVCMQPSHCPPCSLDAIKCALASVPDYAPWHANVPPILWRNGWAWPKLLQRGVRVLFASDWPVGELDPWPSIKRCVEGVPWRAELNTDEDKLSVAETLRCYTEGELRVGSTADFAVLNVNVFKVPVSEWGEVRSLMTWVNGVRRGANLSQESSVCFTLKS